MTRTGKYRPTLEDAIELSGIETLHPGGLALTRRTGEVAGLRPGLRVLDVSSGRGTQAVYYASEFGVEVTGVDLEPDMVESARAAAVAAGVGGRVRFEVGDSRHLPFPDAGFDVAINECAVGIPDEPQSVLDEMLRVLRPGGRVVIHESTWRQPLPAAARQDLAERYGTTPFERDEWIAMLARAGAVEIGSELEPWSSPEMFWRLRRDRTVNGPWQVLSPAEAARMAWRILGRFGPGGLLQVVANQRRFFRAVLDGKLGYGLYWGRKPGGGEGGSQR